MLFNTFAFCCVFLPVALGLYYWLSKTSISGSIYILFAASLGFYAVDAARYLPLLLGSICLNYLAGNAILRQRRDGRPERARWILAAGIVADLAILFFFKYADFFGASLRSATGMHYSTLDLALPIGISFFTFTQIAYLIDCQAGKVNHTQAGSYGLFVTYFPHLIAGPILHHKEMMPQFEDRRTHVFSRGRMVLGAVIFTIGLFKKVILADGVARYVGPVFDADSTVLTLPEAWCGALAYTFQLYFDFSAYSDMAFGLSYMFGIILPINFNSPYRAVSIIDFWRRWHMTLSAFLRDYLYIPLGGNRKGPARRHVNLLITMVLGGLWHGANWTFVVWGALHGIYLVFNHLVRHWLPGPAGPLVRWSGTVLTFTAVVLAWVFFRSPDIQSALSILRSMVAGGFATADPDGFAIIDRLIPLRECLVWLTALAAICFFLPNIYQWAGTGRNPGLESRLAGAGGAFVAGLTTVAALVLLAISETRGVSEFLYFNF